MDSLELVRLPGLMAMTRGRAELVVGLGGGEKYLVRVDVTDEFPFLVTKMSPYYDR
jgi:hypothetical protein